MDLKRNYGYQWNYDDVGSSSDVCADTYRGPSPFSEPETQAIRDFIADWPNIKVALNLYTYGNVLVHPFNYETATTQLVDDYPVAAQWYQNLIQIGGAPSDQGKNSSTSDYRCNGEPSDYMLNEHGIIAASPDLGGTSIYTQTFFINKVSTLTTMLSENYDWILYAAQSVLPQIEVTLGEFVATDASESWSSSVAITNSGITESDFTQLNWVFNTTLFTLKMFVDGTAVTSTCQTSGCTYDFALPSGSSVSLNFDITKNADMSASKDENVVLSYPALTTTSSSTKYQTYNLLNKPVDTTTDDTTDNSGDSTDDNTDNGNTGATDPTDPTDPEPTNKIALKDLLMYIGIGLAVLIFVTLCFLQICLKDGLPCFRCHKSNEFAMNDDEPAEPFVNQQPGRSNLRPTGSLH